MLCPTCGHENLPGADLCDECATSLSQEDGLATLEDPGVGRSLFESEVRTLDPVPGVCIEESDSVAEAVRALQRHDIGCLLVTEGTGRLTGIFSERDLLHRVLGRGLDPDSERVATHMTPDPEVVHAAEPLAHALHLMMVGGFRHLPLVDEAGRPEGIVSSRDLVQRVHASLVARPR